MAGVVENEYDALVDALNKSDYTKSECLTILGEYTKTIISNNVPSNERHGVSLTTADFINRVRKHDWKFAHGFFGNWAKNVQEKNVKDISYEVDDVGC